MTGRLYIDGNDAYTAFGLILSDAKGLATYPPMKASSIKTNVWPDEDGEEVDASGAVLDARTFQVSFVCLNTDLYQGIYAVLSNGAYHTWNFAELGLSRSLRVVDFPSYWEMLRRGKFTLTLAQDTPLPGFTRSTPSLSARDYGFKLDDTNLAAYGIVPLDAATMHNVMKMPSVKENLTVNVPTVAGQAYDDEDVWYKAKDVSLNLYLRAPKASFWSHYLTFLYDLSKPGLRSLYVDAITRSFDCYYKKSGVSQFFVTPTEFCVVFNIVLRFVNFRIDDIEYLLATEAGEFVETEDGTYLIDMKKSL